MCASDFTLREEFRDPEYRQAYADDYLNTYVATQIQVLREQRGLSQEELATLVGTKQPGISRLENINHSSWKTDTLKKIADAFGVRLKISFETYGDLLAEANAFGRKFLQRPTFDKDPAFHPSIGIFSMATGTEPTDNPAVEPAFLNSVFAIVTDQAPAKDKPDAKEAKSNVALAA